MRVLIFSADIGEGHDGPARTLRDGIAARDPEADVTIVDTLEVAGPLVRLAVRSGSELILARLSWLFDAQYWLAARFPPTRRLAGRLITRFARRGMLREIARRHADVVVSTYPGATEVLGRLRLTGALGVPVVSAITDLAALRWWAHPGCDLHLITHPESAAEVRAVAGPRTRVVHVRGLVAPAFERPHDPVVARRALNLEPGAPVVAVSGGGWGIGDVAGAVAAGLTAAPSAVVIALCGRNEALRARLAAAFAHEPRVRVIPFTDRMADLLAATDVLVHSTAGLTVLEALIRGARVISFGWGAGHVRLNNVAYRRFGLAEVVTERAALAAAIARALREPRRPDADYGALPDGAALVMALATS